MYKNKMCTVKDINRMKKKILSVLLGVISGAALISFFILPAQACTSLVLPASDGSMIYGRTMEFAMDIKSEMIAIPRHLDLHATTPGGKNGLDWQGKYAAIGMNAFGLPVLLDGINEKGLAGGVLYFPGEASYQSFNEANRKNTLAPWDLLTWALTNFATVSEVKAALQDIYVADISQANMGFTPPLHYTLHDSTGATLVIEPIHGKLKIYDNSLGVMTNSPSLDWHLTNLRNYVNLSTENIDTVKINNYTVHALGAGSGMHGIPGDSTPSSRFVRAAAYVLATKEVPAGTAGVRMVEHIMNNFDIPKGMVRDNATPPEYTQWTAIADLGKDRYYIKTWDNPVLQGGGFESFDVNGKRIMKFLLPRDHEPEVLKVVPLQ